MKNYKIMMLIALSMSFAVQTSSHRPVAVSADEERIDQEPIARANQRLLQAGILRQLQDALTAGADVNARDNNIDGRTALMRAALDGNENAVRMLLDAGADVHARDNDGWTACKCAVLFGRENIVRMLLAAGADVNVLDNHGEAALVWAAEGGYKNVVRMLLAAGADVNAQSDAGLTALMGAAAHGCENAGRMLLDAGADVHARSNGGQTALMYAAVNENMTRVLLEVGADVNVRNNDDRTALMDAALRGYKNTVRMLLGWNDQMDVLLARDDISDEAKLRLVALEPQTVQDTLDGIQTARQDQASLIHNRAMTVRPEMMQMLQDYLDAHPVSDYLLK